MTIKELRPLIGKDLEADKLRERIFRLLDRSTHWREICICGSKLGERNPGSSVYEPQCPPCRKHPADCSCPPNASLLLARMIGDMVWPVCSCEIEDRECGCGG